MREIKRGIEESKTRVQKLMGVPLLMKVDEGRGKSSLYHGTIVNTFPSLFSVKLDTGEMKTFSYTDVHTKGVMFLKNTE